MDSKGLKNVIFMGKKATAPDAVEFLIDCGVHISAIVAPEVEDYSPTLKETAERHGIPFFHNDTEIYKSIEEDGELTKDCDLVISYLYWRKVRDPLIQLGTRGCINLHPAPLPDYKSRAGYNTAILDKRETFGVTAHFIDSEDFDAGPIIKVLEFPFDHNTDTAYSLENTSQEKLLELFKEVIDMFITNDTIPTIPNGKGLYLTATQLEELKKVDLEKDTPEEIDRKIRAFFFPPYSGAKISIDGTDYTLVNKEMLEYIKELIKK